MSTHFYESKIFTFLMILFTLAVLALTGYIFYPKYQAEAQLESYAATAGAIKISETVKAQGRSNKSGSWTEHIPCITFKLSDSSAPITACKAVGFIDSPDQAKQFLASHYAAASGFTVYVSPDKSKASLDSYSPERARAALLPWVLICVGIPAGNLVGWILLRRTVRRHRSMQGSTTGVADR